MATISYDPTVIHTFATRLYRRAASIVAAYCLAGIAIGFAAGRASSSFIGEMNGGPIVFWIAVFVCAGLGYAFGSEKAFALRLQAQTALCIAQIELNSAAVRAALERRG